MLRSFTNSGGQGAPPGVRRSFLHPGRSRLVFEPLESRRMLSTVYVDLDAGGAGDGSTWGDAYTDLRVALTAATPGDEVWVAEGTYTPTSSGDRAVSFNLKTGVDIYGGFNGSETTLEERDWTTHLTVLSGDLNGDDTTGGEKSENSYHVVYASAVTDATLDGFTITAGNSQERSGGGIYNNGSSSPTLSNVAFSGNSAYRGGGMYNSRSSSPTLSNVTFSDNSACYHGGGMYNNGSSSPTLRNVTFNGNSADMRGGGMYNYDSSSPVLTNVTFSGNSARSHGGGIYNNGSSSPTLTNVTFNGNSADMRGGGMYNYDSSSPALTNVTFSGNSADMRGGGIYNNGSSSPTLTNVTFSGNSADMHGGGMYNYDSSFPTLTNCILCGNTAPDGPQIYNDLGCTTTVTYSIVEGGWAGDGNLDADPLFVDATGGDVRLQSGSPAIDAGSNAGVPHDVADLDGDGITDEPTPLDLDMLPRLVGTSVDMGAYEWREVPLAAPDDAYAVEPDMELSVPGPGVLGNDDDPEGDPLTALLGDGPSHGTLTLSPDGSFVYDPDPGFTGYDSFTYMAVDSSLQSSPATVSIFVAESLGPLDFKLLDAENPSAGDVYYQWTTTHDAFLTLEAIFDDAGGTAELALYNEGCVLLATSKLAGGNQRIDWPAVAGERYFLRLSGTNADVDLRLANLVAHVGTPVTVHGTPGEDLFEFDAAASRLVTINGVAYHFTDAEAASVSFDGGPGADTALLYGNDHDETAELWPGRGTLAGEGYDVQIDNVETITVDGRGDGAVGDLARLHDDDAAKDTLLGGPDAATLSGNGYSNQVVDFRYVHAYGTTGDGDQAVLQTDPNLQDTFEAWPTHAKLRTYNAEGALFFIRALSFRDVRAEGTPGGDDVAHLYGAPGRVDTFIGGPSHGELSAAADYSLRADSFRNVHAHGNAGDDDVATLYDDPGRFDELDACPGEVKLSGEASSLRALAFRHVYAEGTPGDGDVARLHDSATDDTFTARPRWAKLSGDTFFVRANSFGYVHAYSSTGDDVAMLHGSNGKDVFVGKEQFGKLRGTDPKTGIDYCNRALWFGHLHVYGAGADSRDVAMLYDAVLEEGITDPVGMTQVVWLYESERIRERSDGDETITDVVDQVFTVYWE